EWLGGRLAIRPEEGDAMTVAGGIDTDADAVEAWGGGHRTEDLQRDEGTRGTTCVKEESVSLLRKPWARRSLGSAVKAARCTNTLSPSRREQSFPRGQCLRRMTELLTTLAPVWQTGWNGTYKVELRLGHDPGQSQKKAIVVVGRVIQPVLIRQDG